MLTPFGNSVTHDSGLTSEVKPVFFTDFTAYKVPSGLSENSRIYSSL